MEGQMSDGLWVQGTAFPDGECFGCGPRNPIGFRLRSLVRGDGVVAEWTAQPHHAANAGVLCGGVIGTLLDCHTGAAVWWWVNQRHGQWPGEEVAPGEDPAPMYLTAGYDVTLLRPTPIGVVQLSAEVAKHHEPEIVVRGQLDADGKQRASIVARWRRFMPRPQ
jgi:acyl-coenzyme A thioesterase PaaI-like protein